MKKRILGLAMLVVLSAVVLTGCDFGREQKREETYCSDVAVSIETIETAHTTLTDAIRLFLEDLSDSKRQEVLSAIDGLEQAYGTLEELTPPKRFVSVGESFARGVGLARQGTTIYREQFSAVTAETVDDAFVQRIEEGDDLIRQAQSELQKGSTEAALLAAG